MNTKLAAHFQMDTLPLRCRPRLVIRNGQCGTCKSSRRGRECLLMASCYKDRPTAYIGGCDADASLMGLSLRERGFKCSSLLNSAMSRANVLRSMKALMRRSANCEQVVLYFSGHGTQVVGAERDGMDEAIVCDGMDLIYDNEISAILETCSDNCHLLCIFDCCHSGTMTDLPVLNWTRDGPMRLTIAACTESETAQQYAGRGVLTAELLGRMQRGDMDLATLHGKRLRFGQCTTVSGSAPRGSLSWL